MDRNDLAFVNIYEHSDAHIKSPLKENISSLLNLV